MISARHRIERLTAVGVPVLTSAEWRWIRNIEHKMLKPVTVADASASGAYEGTKSSAA